MAHFMKKPCKKCPFRRDVRPYLRPERGRDLAYSTTNKYNSFTCHETLESDDEGLHIGAKSKECAGFLTMQVDYTGKQVEGFEPSFDMVYEDYHEMADAYENGDT